MSRDQWEHLERLIARHLDGQLSPDEELELQRHVLRDPEARAMLEDYRAIDAVARDVLAEVLDANPTALDVDLLPDPRLAAPRRGRTWWWKVPAALAAMLAIALTARVYLGDGGVVASRDGSATDPSEAAPAQLAAEEPISLTRDRAPLERPVYRQVSDGPRRTQRQTDRDLLGIVGEDGTMYWIELDRTRTLTRPSEQAPVRLASSEL